MSGVPTPRLAYKISAWVHTTAERLSACSVLQGGA